MTVTSRIPLSTAARKLGLSAQGALKVLKRSGNAIRDDGRWFADPADIDQIQKARRLLGVDCNRSRIKGDKIAAA
jgi:hypothetical protein